MISIVSKCHLAGRTVSVDQFWTGMSASLTLFILTYHESKMLILIFEY